MKGSSFLGEQYRLFRQVLAASNYESRSASHLACSIDGHKYFRNIPPFITEQWRVKPRQAAIVHEHDFAGSNDCRPVEPGKSDFTALVQELNPVNRN